jgi:hypothetical protein
MTNARYSSWLAYTIVTIGALAASAGSAEAQERKKPRAPKVIELEEIKIEGRVQKPNAFYILNRSNIGYEVMELRTSFINEVVRSVRRDPF